MEHYLAQAKTWINRDILQSEWRQSQKTTYGVALQQMSRMVKSTEKESRLPRAGEG